MKIFSDRNEDLEARSRRFNLCITRIQEKLEAGKNPTDFVTKLLRETLGLEKEPLLDRSHHTLRVRPQEDQPPRAFVVRFHYYREKEAILRKAATATDLTMPHRDRIRVFPDYTQATVVKRHSFTDPVMKNVAVAKQSG
ncbi:LINE-1 type transposase domain containing protein 1 [Dissostichus eleginoides]|uniref:LINE-1 type transposase domain containing protein 1 n=1 Tax=Dissostichus eleginoides TaxID=100907 RepID=A0AAD9CIG0_DISEL|nr:LINE-1 type transposase domain containing protein 1 [Dissostichus eleginoides]